MITGYRSRRVPWLVCSIVLYVLTYSTLLVIPGNMMITNDWGVVLRAVLRALDPERSQCQGMLEKTARIRKIVMGPASPAKLRGMV